MFKINPNHQEANNLVTLFSKVFNFIKFNEEFKPFTDFNISVTTYTAITDDNWELNIEFYNKRSSKSDQKSYYPEIKFRQLGGERVPNFDEEQHKDRTLRSKAIADLLQKKYNPDFDRMIAVLKIFVEKGIECGVFKSLSEKKYKKVMKTHLNINHYSGTITIADNNFGTVTFNNILQKVVQGYHGETHFKKSYISVSIDYLAHSDNTMHPYFKIRLPYSESKKSTCVIPLTGKQVVYFMANDDKLRRECIDKLPSISMDETELKDFFNKEFFEEMKICVAKKLKIDKSMLNNITPEELKDYFAIVEMVNI